MQKLGLFTWIILICFAGLLMSGCAAVNTAPTANSAAARPSSTKYATLIVPGVTLAPATLNVSYSSKLQADGGAPPYRWSLAGGALPSGLSLDRVGNLSGTPTKAGIYYFAVRVSDGESPAATATGNFEISVNGSQNTISISTASLPGGTANAAYSATIQATGGTSPYSWSIASGQLPTGLVLNASVGTVSGTPTTSGSFSFTAKVTDGSGASSQKAFAISIASSQQVAPLAIATSSVASGTEGTGYSTALQATGGTTPYTWSLAAGSLPSGVGLNSSNGVLSGTPTASGQFSFTAKVTDANSSTVQKTFSLTISAANTTSPLAITTVNLPDGAVNKTYSAKLGAIGGTTPYTWTLTTGSLPAGLSMSADGSVSGVPTASASTTFSVQVKDATGSTQAANIAIYVASAPTTTGTPVTSCGALKQSGATYVLQNDVSAAGTCFSIQASDITLDLNGHTVTYGTCEGTACWQTMGTITSISRTSNVVTLTFSTAVSNIGKRWIQVSNVADASFNGYFKVDSQPTSNSVTYAQTAANASSSGGTARVSSRRHAIMGQACWDAEVDGNPCDGTFNNTTIKNGKIVQGTGVGPYSDVIRFGQGGGTGLKVHDVTITYGAPSTKAILTTWAYGGHSIYNNTIYNNVKTIINRHQMDGATMRLSDDTSTNSPNLIYGNTIIGSAQGGILTWTPNSKIYNNVVKLDSYYTNDFCFYAYGAGQEFYGNTCDNSLTSGRGIHVMSPNVSVHDNIIKVRALPRNAEYNGCESGGTYAVQLEGNGTTGVQVYNNDITAIAGACDATGLRATWMVNTSKNRMYNNLVNAVRETNATASASGATFSNSDGGVIFDHNTIYADTAAVYIPYDGSTGMQWIGNTFAPGKNPTTAGWLMFKFRNAAASTGWIVQDLQLADGGTDSVSMLTVGSPSWAGASELQQRWTVVVKVVDSTGGPVSGASVAIRDAKGAAAFSGATNSSGLATAVLTQARYYNTSTSSSASDNFNPYTVSVSGVGYSGASLALTVDSAKTLTVTLK